MGTSEDEALAGQGDPRPRRSDPNAGPRRRDSVKPGELRLPAYGAGGPRPGVARGGMIEASYDPPG